MTHEVPELRIVDQKLLDRLKARQQSLMIGPLAFTADSLLAGRRPKYILAGLIKCGQYGGSYTLTGKHLLGCVAARDRGTCDNRLNIRTETLEASVLNGLRKHLMDPALFKEFCVEFTQTVNRLRMERRAGLVAQRKELDCMQRDLDRAIQAIVDGVPRIQLKDRIGALETRKAELQAILAEAAEPPTLLTPTWPRPSEPPCGLSGGLAGPACRSAAVETLNALVDRVDLVPENGELSILLRGDLAAMLSFASNKKTRHHCWYGVIFACVASIVG